MHPATPLQATHQLPPNRPCFPVPQQSPSLQDKLGSLLHQPSPSLLEELGIPPLQPQPAPCQSKAHEPPAAAQDQPGPRRIPPAAQDQPGPRRVPRLRAVVESQAFKNILVDEMDLMLTRAATLIQANWRGYQLRQKLVSQMTAAKAIQEAWRRFHTRRLLRSSRAALRRAVREEGDADIPYHAPQQVRFQPLVDECLGCQPVMVNKETQCPSTNSLATCTQQSPAPLARASGAGRTCSVAFPQPTLPTRLTCPLNLEQKFQTSLLSKMVRNTSVVQQIETEVVKAKPVAARAPRGLEPPPYGRSSQAVPGGLRVQTQAQVDAECLRPPPSPAAPATATKPFLKAYSGISTIRPPAQACPVPTSRTLTQKCAMPTPGTVPTPPQTCSAPAMPRPPAHAHLVVSLTSTSTQTHSPGSLLKVPAPMCLLSSIKMPPQTHPTAAGSKAPTTPCPGPGPVKTSPQVRLAVAPTQSPAVGPSKSSSQTSPAVAGPRPAPQARLAAMLTRTPAHIRNVAAVLKTLCLVHPAVGTLKTPPPATVTSGGPCTPQPVSAPKAKTTVSVKQTAGTVRVSSQSFLLDRKARAGPQPRVNTGAPKGPAKAPLDTEKMKSCAPKHPKPEMVSKSSMTLAMTTASSWTKVAEGKPKPVVQTQQRTEVIRVQSRLLMPMEASMSLPLTKATAQTQTPTRQSKAMFQPRLATAPPATPAQSPPVPCLSKAASPGSAAAEQAKALCQAQLTSCLGRSHPAADLTMVLPNAYPTACPPAAQPHPQLSACLTKTAAHLHPPATQTQVLSQAHLATRLIKVSSQLYSSTEQRRTPSRPHTAASPAKPSEACAPTKLTKASSLAHLVTCLTQVHSHARGPAGLGGDMARCIYRARPPSTHLSSKAQSQPLLAGASSRVSAQTCQDLGPLGSVTRSQSEGRAAHVLPHSQVPGPSVPGPCPAIAEAASMLVPLLASVGCACNVESWGDGEPMSGTRAPPNQMLTCPEDVAASQTASLCAELAAMLGSQEDLRSLLARALSQGEVRAALNQALGATVAKALPHSMLSTALTKALSWGELGVTLTRALSRGELRMELAKAMQGKLTDMLSKALSGEERLALSQTLCPGEPGTVFSQPVSHVSPRPATTLPKAPSTLAGSRMTMPSAPRAVDCRVGPSQSWGAAVSPSGRLPSRKVRADHVVAAGLCALAALTRGMEDSAAWVGPSCSPPAPRGALATAAPHHSPLSTSPGPSLSWPEIGLHGKVFSKPGTFRLCLAPRAGRSLVDLDLLAGGEGHHLPKSPCFQPPPSPGQVLTANGVGSSSSRPPASGGVAPSSPHSPVASRVAPHSWMPAGEGSMASLRASGRRAPHSPQAPTSPPGSSCWCQSLGASRASPILCTCSVARCLNHLSKVTENHIRSRRQVSPRAREGAGAPGAPRARLTGAQLPASPDTGKVQARPRVTGHRQQKTPRKGAISALPYSRGPAAKSHQPMSLLDELVTGLPRHPREVLANSFLPGAADRREGSGSLSLVHSSSSFSPWSVASATELPERPWAPDPCLPLRDWAGEGQADSEDRVCPVPTPPRQPQASSATGKRLLQTLCHSTTAGPKASGLHGVPGRDSGQDTPAMELPKGPPEPGKAGLRRSLSLGAVVPARVPRPNPGPLTLDPGPPKLTVAGMGAPGQGPPPGAPEGPVPVSQPPPAAWPDPGQAQPTESSKGPLGCTNLPIASGGFLNFVQPSTGCVGVSSFVQPSMGCIGVPSFVQPSMGAGGFPAFVQPCVAGGGPSNFVQPSMANGGSPSFVHPTLVSGGPLNFFHTSIAGGNSQNVPQPSMASEVPPNIIQPSMAGGGPQNFVQPSLAGGGSSNFSRSSMAEGGPPNCVQPTMGGVGSPTLSQLSTASTGSSSVIQTPLCLRAAPRLTPAFVAAGFYPGLPQLSMATMGALSLVQPSVVFGVGHGFREPVSPPMPPQAWLRGATPSPARDSSEGRVAGPPSSPPGHSMVGCQGPGAEAEPGTPWISQVTAAVVTGLGQVPAPGRPPVLQTSSPLPPALDTQHHSEAPTDPLSPQYMSAAPQGPPVGMASGRLHTALGNVALSLSPGSVVSSSGQSVCPEPWVHRGAPGSMGDGVAQRLHSGSVAGGITHRRFLGTMAGSMAQRCSPGTVANGMAQNPSPGTLAGGETQSPSPGTMGYGVAQSPSLGTVAGGVAQSLSPGTVVNGMTQTPSPGTMGSSVSPSCSLDPVANGEPSEGGRQGPCLPGGPSGGLATLSPPAGSLLVGISPRPYQAALAMDRSLTSPQAPCTAGLAQGHPGTPEEPSGLREEQAEPGGKPVGPMGVRVSPGGSGRSDGDCDHQIPRFGRGTPGQAIGTAIPRAMGPGATRNPLAPLKIVVPSPTGHLLGTACCNELGRPLPPCALAADLPLGSVAGAEASRGPWRPAAATSVSSAEPYLPSSLKAASQADAVPSGTQKPQGPNIPHGHKPPSKAAPDSLVSALLGGAVLGMPPASTSQALASATPTLHPRERQGCTRDPSAPPRLHRVSLGYESTSSGSWKRLDPGSWTSLHSTPAATQGIPSPPATSQAQRKCHIPCPPAPRPSVASLTPTVLQGPVDAGVAGCPSWNPAAAVVTSRPMDRSVALGGSSRELAMGRWAPVGSMADTRQPGTLMVSVQAMEKMVVQAVVIIQACARGYLVRRAIKVWHQWATVIQATWRGHRVRRNLAQLYRATIIIQAAWRGYCTRRERARRQLLPIIWAEPTSHVRLLSHRPRTHLSEGRLASDHRCFLSCQPDVCSLCQALSPGLPAPPSVVMLVGSSPRTCHMCGHTLATRVVQGMGRSVHGQDAKPWAWASTQGSLQLCNQNRAATAIQSAWRGFRTRCLLRRQQVAAKVLQSTWRGHYTRSCLTTDALLGLPGQWNAPSRALPHASRWPGV